MDKKLTKYTKISSPHNKQTYLTVQTVTDNTIKYNTNILYNWSASIRSEYWNHIFICINWNM